MPIRPIEFVFFDVGNTLLFANRKQMLASLHARGIHPPEEQLQAIERRTKNEFDDIVEHGGKADLSFWNVFYQRLFEELDLHDEALREQVIASTRLSANWDQLRPGTREALDTIGRRYPVAVISNADGKIADLLHRCGIGDCFRTITDSGIVGHEKPSPVIFETALKSMGATAQQSLYVGDVYSVDYCGATAAGMQAVLFDALGAYRNRELPRVESLEELIPMIV
jgi:HAD superfamily hydrolase (TIGR01549 family)